MNEVVRPQGYITATLRYKHKTEILKFKNKVLDSGKKFLADSLLEKPVKPFYIASMLFGDGGTEKEKPKEVLPTMTSLSGTARVKKDVIAQIDPEFPTQAVFTAVVEESEGNNFTLNEMALVLNDGTLFSLSTFPDLNKTDQFEIAWMWVVSFI